MTVTVEPEPEHDEVAVGDVKLDKFGLAFTVKDATLSDDIAVLHNAAFAMLVSVTVVAPTLANEAAGMQNVPLPKEIAMVAVLLVEVLAPLKL